MNECTQPPGNRVGAAVLCLETGQDAAGRGYLSSSVDATIEFVVNQVTHGYN